MEGVSKICEHKVATDDLLKNFQLEVSDFVHPLAIW